MIVVSQNRDGFVNIDTINEITVDDGKIIARYGSNMSILGEYDSDTRAEQCVRDIVDRMRQGKTVYELPKSKN